ncbi:condensation domain-containing protein [Microlunatus soli]|uniref:HxxPF-repeated domain-containing protein n=1 Tax=Microlunatus soli TaxID=630515 RepID=A0A1H1VT87_9ACTN|nr:condensation domain-containing protein [Microlunatus soli]SDS87865.1 HxxPF-repeated domain-containing protein [Microlunatus soli]
MTGATAHRDDIADRSPAPLSPVQARMWFLHQLRPNSPEYNLQLALRIRGPLHRGALINAIGLVIARHEPLRTQFLTDERGVPQQDTLPTWQAPIRTHRPDNAPSDVDALARAVVQDEVNRPFDLTAAPPLRVRLVQLGTDDHVLTLTLHHILIDGWSIGLLAEELALSYRALTRGTPLRLPELTIGYRDYARWSDRLDTSGVDFWRRELAGVQELELPADRAGHGVGAELITCRRVLAASTAGGLAATARECGSSLFAVGLAGYLTLLHRYGGQRDFAVGMPVANRTQSRLQPLIGCFLNTICVRARIDPRQRVSDLVRQTGDALARSLAYQHVPFEQVVRGTGAQRGNDRNPLFSAFCSALDAAPPTFDLDGLDTELIVADYPRARFDLNATFALAADPATIQLEFSAALFDLDTAERIADQLIRILDWFAAGIDQQLDEVPILGTVERSDLLEMINGDAR